MEPLIFTVDAFFGPAECREQIKRAESLGFGDAPIIGSRGAVIRKDIRNNERAMIDDVDTAADLFERIRDRVPTRIGSFDLVGINERLRYYRYDPGQAFRWHYDGSFRRDNGQCSHLTMMVYLNDDFSGGETRFVPQTNAITVRPKAGMALFFTHAVLHEGSEVTSGRKYVLRTDVMYSGG